MSYKVKVDTFEGPFDLLLQLVTRQKVDIAAISITEITDQYLAEIERMRDLDLDIASDFLVVAATLLQMKAKTLVPRDDDETQDDFDDEFDDLSPAQARDILVERLVVYKQFKNAAATLGSRMENEGHMHPRHAGLEPQFLNLMPDYLEGMTLHGLAVICADITARRDVFLLEAEHVAAVPISMEKHAEGIYRTIRRKKNQNFSKLIGDEATPELVVVTFLAVLELYKRGVLSLNQAELFGDIELNLEDDAPEIVDFSVPDWGMPEEDILDEDVLGDAALGEGIPGEGVSGEDVSDEGAPDNDMPDNDVPDGDISNEDASGEDTLDEDTSDKEEA